MSAWLDIHVVCEHVFLRLDLFLHRSFWTLSGAPNLLADKSIRTITHTKGCTPAQALFRVAQMNEVIPLSGTTKEPHMDDAVSAEKLDLGDVQSSVDGVLKIIRA